MSVSPCCRAFGLNYRLASDLGNVFIPAILLATTFALSLYVSDVATHQNDVGKRIVSDKITMATKVQKLNVIMRHSGQLSGLYAKFSVDGCGFYYSPGKFRN